jgi:hypothetical protein
MSEPPAGPGPANEPLDAEDHTILAELRAAYDIVDPPPADLNERAGFAIRLADLDFEVARLYELSGVGANARAEETTRTATFESDSLTIMITISGAGDGRRRVEGWLAPAEALEVELRVGGSAHDRSFRAPSGDTGRFLFDDVPSGLAQFLVHRNAQGQPGSTAVVTSPIAI